MEKEVKIGLILSAYDRASEVLEKVFGKSKKQFAELKNAAVDFGKGTALIGAGMAGLKLLQQPVEAFAKMEASGNDLKAAMMGPGGILDENTYKRIAALSMDLSDKYKGSATDYIDMVKVLKQNRIDETDVLGGIGEATAKLSDLFDMAPAHIAEFSAHMRNDMGVAVADMEKVMDLVARVHGSGVGKTGSEAVTEMNEFFSKASLGAANLGVQGLEASKQLGALGALFMSRGLSGATVGTNFRRIFDGLRDGEKVGKANEVAGIFGKHLNFFDKKGQFLGIDNFVREGCIQKYYKPQQQYPDATFLFLSAHAPGYQILFVLYTDWPTYIEFLGLGMKLYLVWHYPVPLITPQMGRCTWHQKVLLFFPKLYQYCSLDFP